MTFKALLANQTGDTISSTLADFEEEDLMPGVVTVAVEYSMLDDQGAMALSGWSPVIRHLPLIPRIDIAGVVESSTYPGLVAGDRVLANGWGLKSRVAFQTRN